jgi:phthiodiolone/phenolphthiodiolone dimycocerosates ketoreductase
VPQRFTRSDLDAAIAKVPVDLMAETVLWGSLDYVHVQLRNFIDAGLRHLVIQPISALVSKRDAAFSLKSMVTLQRRLKREGV